MCEDEAVGDVQTLGPHSGLSRQIW